MMISFAFFFSIFALFSGQIFNIFWNIYRIGYAVMALVGAVTRRYKGLLITHIVLCSIDMLVIVIATLVTHIGLMVLLTLSPGSEYLIFGLTYSWISFVGFMTLMIVSIAAVATFMHDFDGGIVKYERCCCDCRKKDMNHLNTNLL